MAARTPRRRAPRARPDTPPARGRFAALVLRLRRRVLLLMAGLLALVVGAVALFSQVNPPWGLYMIGEYRRLGAIERQWVPIEAISGHMARSAVAAEDANFCRHWGFDMAEIRRALDAGGARGASTITQQTVKNVYLWHGRSWSRKALEAALTPAVELFWSKPRILEVYLNVAEFGEGIFGIEAAARHYYGSSAADLGARQAARLAVLLPSPKTRHPERLSPALQRRANSVMDGAATILADGRADCLAPRPPRDSG